MSLHISTRSAPPLVRTQEVLMALIAIVLKDLEDGSLDIQAHAEPYIPDDPEAELTGAQTAAQVMVGALAATLAAAAEVEEEAEVAADAARLILPNTE